VVFKTGRGEVTQAGKKGGQDREVFDFSRRRDRDNQKAFLKGQNTMSSGGAREGRKRKKRELGVYILISLLGRLSLRCQVQKNKEGRSRKRGSAMQASSYLLRLVCCERKKNGWEGRGGRKGSWGRTSTRGYVNIIGTFFPACRRKRGEPGEGRGKA